MLPFLGASDYIADFFFFLVILTALECHVGNGGAWASWFGLDCYIRSSRSGFPTLSSHMWRFGSTECHIIKSILANPQWILDQYANMGMLNSANSCVLAKLQYCLGQHTIISILILADVVHASVCWFLHVQVEIALPLSTHYWPPPLFKHVQCPFFI